MNASLHGGSSASASLSHKTLTLNLESSPFSFDFEPQHQPHIFDWTLSLTLSPSRPASAAVAPRQPHVFDCTSSLTISPLWLPSVVVAPRQPHPHGLPPWLRVILILPLTPNTCLREYKEQVASNSGKSQLDTCLEEATLNLHFIAHMHVLDWWKNNSPRFPHLSIMACDLLSIPVTTVASESAFSIGSRILNKYRNRLSSDCVEAIICTRNWKHGFNEDSIVKTTSSKGASNVVDVD
ncbi:hypothetical protein JHK85_053560 [Glycine max]|nr:hypothetical protein JHK86_052706 [Glycine max]KAG4927074.1 hypothetical protein JHK85_053560 [Glycine max]